jgi:uncharacterized protein (TIGR00730 family)
MRQALCVYCSSSDAVAPIYFETAEEVGARLARQGYTLVYGGGRIGLMGALARAVHQNGGQVIGVIPEFLRSKGLAYEAADELIITRDLRERKAAMEARADGFVTLPGGFGTLEEALEIITLKQLGLHAKPVVMVNTQGFYNSLLELVEHIYQERFAKPEYRRLYYFASDVDEAFSYLATYQPTPLSVNKWF